VTVHKLSRTDARRIAVRAQLLDSSRPATLLDAVRQLTLLQRDPAGRAALLSPFDRLVHDRKRTTELFEFDYQLEMYKPAATRRWGYFALPVLYGDRLVGKLDATADRTAGVLRVHAIHRDSEFSAAMTAEVGSEIEDLAHWLELDLTRQR
jgi:uncharacterized protein YcaQ